MQSVADRLKQAYKDFGKHDKKRKTPEYKNKRLSELKELWDKFNELNKYITDELDTPETSLENLKMEINDIYVKYHEKLMLLADTSSDNNEDNEQESGYEPATGQEPINDEKVRQLIATQEVRFDNVNRIVAEIEDMINTEEPVSVSWGKIKIAALNKYFDRIETTHEEIAVLKPPRSYMKKKQLIEREYEATLIILQDNMEIKSVEGIKLPRLEITKFTGSYFEWVNFRDLFQASVVDNKNLANAQKMQLLRTHLDKEAKDLIKDLTLTNNNFKVHGQGYRIVMKTRK